jgi:2-keto-4-pentenoate hydratase/2-oxohepta-3-ene-1,7-dioic acid hydratase in catechol pathway
VRINNIHCLALNYKGIGEINQDPIYFLKSTSCLAYEGDEIKYPKFNTIKVWTEVELGIAILNDCENINEEEAYNYIKGFFIAGDITCSNLYDRDHHLASSKARVGFCPISTKISKIDLDNKSISMKTYINNELKQHGDLLDIIFNPYKSVSYISKFTKLQKGDIILTGTPSTINGGPQFDCLVKPGDTIKHTIDNLGELNYKFSL